MNQPPRFLPAPEGYPEGGLYYAPRPVGEASAVPLNHYFWLLRRHKWRILGFVMAVVTAVLLYSLQMTPMFESVATLEIDNQAQLFEIGNSGLRFDNRNFDTVVATQLEMMNSPVIAEQVIRELHLERIPDFNPALRKAGPSPGDASFAPSTAEPPVPPALPGLRLARRPDTYLIEVRYRSPNPELASAIANATAQVVIQQGFKTRYQTAAELSKWLDKQLEELRAKLERAQANLRAYEKEHSVVNPEDRTNLLNQQLTKLQEELTRAQAERLRKEAAFRAVEKGDLETLSISEQGQPLMQLAERVENLESQLAEVGIQYGPNHPNYKRAENQLNRARGLMESYKQKVLNRVRADYEQALSRERALSEAVAGQKDEVDRLSARAAEYGILKRDVESQTKLYDELLKKINEASINASIKATNLRLASLATPPGAPVWPNIPLNVTLALLLS
ncbi:MAG: GumC family protein, partial [Acidobacteria bacterium]|nr:GumC family protein [Acidobacteriota bacterium]